MAKEQVLFFNEEDWVNQFNSTEDIEVVGEDELPDAPVSEEDVEEQEKEEEEIAPVEESEETTKEAEEEKEEEDEEEKYSRFESLTAAAEYIADKYKLEFDKTSLKTEEDVVDFFEQFTDFYIGEKWETVKNTNAQTAKVFEVLEKEGNIEGLIALFNQQKELVDLDIKEETGQKQIIERYYSEIVKWSKDKIKKNIERWEANDELLSEAQEAQEKYQEVLAAKQAKEVEKELALATQREEIQKQKINALGGFLTQKGLKKDEIQSTLSFVYQDAFKLPNGEKITQLDKAILDFQKNPEKLFELTEFLKDSDKYIQKKIAEITSKESNKTFDKILSNNKNKKGGEAPAQTASKKEKVLKFNFN